MKKFTTLCAVWMLALSPHVFAQTTVSWEDFPNTFNSTISAPVHDSFQGDIGFWQAVSTDAKATLSVNNGILKFYNHAPSGSTGAESWARATSPVVQCNVQCIASAVMTFDLYTSSVNQSNTCGYFRIDISGNGGSTWMTAKTWTGQQLFNAYGQATWHNVTVDVPASMLTSSNFRYRFVALSTQSCAYDNNVYIDNPKLIVQPCPPVGPICLGNLIWNDRNLNGVPDAGEPGVPNATVKLYNDANNDDVPDGSYIKTTTTDANGMYKFDSLAAGNYIVGVVLPFSYIKGPASTIDPDNDVDNDNNGVNLIGPNMAGGEVRSKAITLSVGGEPNGGNCNLTLDIGLCQPNSGDHNVLSLGNLVWKDTDLDGFKDTNEPGVPNAAVKLYMDANNDDVADGAAIMTTTTDANGMYKFDSLAPGNYIVGVIIPTGYVRGTTSSIDPDNNVDNDNNGANLIGNNQAGSEIRSKAITLAAGTEPTNDGDGNNGNMTLDIGLCEPSTTQTLTLGNLVWLDSNGNNMKDASEPGIAGATVKLYKDDNNDNTPDGAAIATTTTNSSGNYTFSNLAPGNYIVGVIIPTGYTRGPSATADPDDNVDNDNNGVYIINSGNAGGEERSKAITLAAGTEPTNDGDGNNGNLTLDLALCPANVNLLSLGNLVWKDMDCDGFRDADETHNGIAGVTLKLYKDTDNNNIPDGPAIRVTTTNSSGMYRFDSLSPGNYIVGAILPSGYRKGTTSATSSDVNNNVDNDNNGINLIGNNAAGSEVRTNAITLALGTEPTNDGDSSNGNMTLDIGFCTATAPHLLTLGNRVWKDANCNGWRDSCESSISGATVFLYKDANNDNVADGAAIDTTTTDADGYYYFDKLQPGNYIVGVKIPTGYMMGHATTADPDNDVNNDNNGVILVGNNGAGGEVRSKAITLAAGTEPTNDGDGNNGNLTLDFGLCKTAPTVKLTLGNKVWCDLNLNGMIDGNEFGVKGVTVKLYKDDNNDNVPDGGAIKTTTTNYYGKYYFTDLAAGNYIVAVTLPSGYMMGTASSIDPDNNVDNDNNGVYLSGNNGAGGVIRSKAITLAAGTEPTNDGDGNNSNLTLDFGLKCQSSGQCHDNDDDHHDGDDDDDDDDHHGHDGHDDRFAPVMPVITSSIDVTAAVYPNPATTSFMVRLNAVKQSTASISVTDVQGRTVLLTNKPVSTGVNYITLNEAATLKPGMYNVQAIIDGNVITKKLMIASH